MDKGRSAINFVTTFAEFYHKVRGGRGGAPKSCDNSHIENMFEKIKTQEKQNLPKCMNAFCSSPIHLYGPTVTSVLHHLSQSDTRKNTNSKRVTSHYQN